MNALGDIICAFGGYDMCGGYHQYLRMFHKITDIPLQGTDDPPNVLISPPMHS